MRRRFEQKRWKRENLELELIGIVESDGFEKLIVTVKVRNNVREEVISFVTINLNEFLIGLNEGKLDKIQ